MWKEAVVHNFNARQTPRYPKSGARSESGDISDKKHECYPSSSSSDTTTLHGFLSSSPGHSRLFCLWRCGSDFSVLSSLYHLPLRLSIYSLAVLMFLFLTDHACYPLDCNVQ